MLWIWGKFKMKYFLLMMLSFNVHALTVISQKAPLIDASPYLDKPAVIEQSIQAMSLDEMPFPVKSQIKPGIIESKKIEGMDFPYPVYVLGNDESSQKWLAKKIKLI